MVEPIAGSVDISPSNVSVPAQQAVAPDAEPAASRAIGIDIGGTGVKGGVVDLVPGELVSPRIRRPTPQPSTPDAVMALVEVVVKELIDGGWATHGMPAGCGLPGVVKFGQLKTAANIDPGWVDAPVQQLLADRLGRPVAIGNDADVAGMAELLFGAARGQIGDGPHADARHGHRQRPLRGWPAGAEHRVRASPVPRQGRREAAQRDRARAARPELEDAGPRTSTSTSPRSSSTSGPT